MINHSSSNSNATQILSDLLAPDEHVLKALISSEVLDPSYESDNE